MATIDFSIQFSRRRANTTAVIVSDGAAACLSLATMALGVGIFVSVLGATTALDPTAIWSVAIVSGIIAALCIGSACLYGVER